MSKNLTRKGLALGAVVALASTVIAGSPAFAAGEVIFAPTTGTSYTTFTTDDFALSASLAPGQVAGNIAQLAYHIAGDATGAFEYTTGAVAADATTATTATAQVVRPTVTVGAVNVLNIGLKAADQVAATATKSVVVTAFIDSNNDSILDAGEFQQARTITFKKLADVVATVTLTSPLPGDTTLKATAVLAEINAEQTAANTTVTFTATGQTLSAASATAGAAGSYQKTVSALAAADVVTARVSFGSDALGSAAVSATVPAASIIRPLSGPVTSANAVAAVAVAGGTNATVRTNSAFAVEATIKTAATGNAVLAGKAVTAAITAGTLTTTRTLSINGTVYNGTVALPTALALTSDAAGKAKVDLVTVGFAAGEAVTVVFKSENQTATTVATAADAAYTVVSSAVGSALRSIDEAGSTTFNYVVKDQFGVAIASAARLKFVVGYGTSSVAAPATTYVALSGGTASVTVTDTTASTLAAITVNATLETQTASTSNWAAASTPIVAAQQTVNVASGAVAFDFNPAAASALLSTDATITASVSRAGAAVTISSKGVTFTVDGVAYTDTVTLFSGDNGDVSVAAKSDISGARTITFTSGAVSKTAVLTVAAAGETTGTVLTLDAPANILPGRTLLVTGKLVDKFGNAVDITTSAATLTVVYTGPGLLVGSLPTSTETDGTFSFRVLLGASETGSAVVSATYDSNGATADVAGTTVAVTVAKTITIGAVAVAANSAKIATKNGRVYVTVVSPAGFKAYVKVGFSSKPAFTTTGSKLVSYYVGAGKRVAVRVYVRGGIVASQAVTVK